MGKIVIELVDANTPPKVMVDGTAVPVERLDYLYTLKDGGEGRDAVHQLSMEVRGEERTGVGFILLPDSE